MSPTIIGKATLHNMDCMDLLKATPDKFYDLAVVDPPYGIGFGDYERGSGVHGWLKAEAAGHVSFGKIK